MRWHGGIAKAVASARQEASVVTCGSIMKADMVMSSLKCLKRHPRWGGLCGDGVGPDESVIRLIAQLMLSTSAASPDAVSPGWQAGA